MPGLIFACFLLGGLPPGTDYCTNSYCDVGVTNVGCNPPPASGGTLCDGKTPEAINFTPAQITLILQKHNEYRSLIAAGGFAGFPSASRMATLQWDDELASQAGHNARSCDFEHDACRNTPDFAWAGQNLAYIAYSGVTMTVEDIIDDSVQMWWIEYFDATPDQINSYPSGYTGPAIGHFTQLASDRSWKVGCAMQRWEDTMTRNYFVCNYSFTNLVGQPVYVQGATASGCTTGTNPAYESLCSVDEVVESVP